MHKKSLGMLCLSAALCVGLSGCAVKVNDNVIGDNANYNIQITLPYATATPAPVAGSKDDPLVINSEGAVTLNDSSILNNGTSAADSQESNYKALSFGNTGLAVQALQARLAELGYYNAEITGLYDAETEAAVRRFEQTYGTMQIGSASPRFQARLFAEDAPVYGSNAYVAAVVSQYVDLQRGDVGSSVYALQQRLVALGYPIENTSGIYDDATANAVMLFYSEYGLGTSDIATVALQRELYSDEARTYSGSETAWAEGDDSEKESSSSNAVLAVQQRLATLGYLKGTPSGTQDTATYIAICMFEQASGQTPTGAITTLLRSMLASETAPSVSSVTSKYKNLIEGSSGEQVKALQDRLVELGYAQGTGNGEYGTSTSSGIRLFQKKNGLPETGVADAYLQAVLFSSYCLDINGNAHISAAETAAPEEDEVENDAFVTLSSGSEGDDVLNLQNHLASLGYVCSITGTYDALTARSVSLMQQQLGMEPDGMTTEDMLLFVCSSAAPRNGININAPDAAYRRLTLDDSGNDVTKLQKTLWEHGLLKKSDISGSVGTYNQATADAVTALQQKLGYETTNGVAGIELQRYIYSDGETLFD